MFKQLGLISSFFFCTSFSSLANDDDKITELTLATTHWCPYTCFESKNEFGVVGAYIDKIMSSYSIQLSVSSYPWSRAIHLANAKKVDGLLTATPSEAPELIFTNSPIASYQMCFYTLKPNRWTYKGDLNFNDNVLAVIQDYSYDQSLDTFIENNVEVITIFGSEATQRLIQLLLTKRADIIAVDKLVLAYVSKNQLIDVSGLKNAGCLAKNDFYLALTPSTENKNLIGKLDRDLQLKENIDYYNELITQFYNK